MGKAATFIAPALAGLAIGLIAAWLIWSAEKPPAQSATQRTVPSEADVSRARSPATSPQWHDEASPSLASARAESPVNFIALALQSDAEHPRGQGVITGLITRPDGTGVPDVEVHAMPSGGEPLYSSEHEDLESLRREIERLRVGAAGRLLARTDADGAFTIQGVNEGEYRVAPVSPHYEIRLRSNLPNWRIRAGDHLAYTAQPIVRLRLNVLSPDGGLAPQACIQYRADTARRHEWQRIWWVPDEPEVGLPPGKFDLYAEEEYDGLQMSETVVIELAEGDKPETLTLPLKRRNALLGQVLPPTEPGLGQLTVHMQPAHEGQGKAAWTRVDSDGHFEIKDLAPGEWSVILRDADEKPLQQSVVTISEGATRITMNLPEPGRESFFVIYVEGPDGQALSDVRFMVAHFRDGTRYRGWPSHRREEDGAFWIRKQAQHIGGTVHWWEIEIHHSNLGVVAVPYGPQDSHDIRVRFEEAALLVVETPWAEQHPDRRNLELLIAEEDQYLRRRALWLSREPRKPLAVTTELKARQPGQVTVQLAYNSGGGTGGNPLVLSSHPVQLRPGRNTLRLDTPPPMHELTVRAPDGLNVAYMQLLRPGEEPVSGLPAAAGRVTFPGVPAGEYLLRHSRAEGQMRVRVPATGVIEFAPEPENAWVVKPERGLVEAARAGLHAGDIVLSINGRNGAGAHELGVIVQSESKTQTVTLQLRSRGAETTLAIPGEQFRRLLESGLRLEPILVDVD
jgi:hypothetical protein